MGILDQILNIVYKVASKQITAILYTEKIFVRNYRYIFTNNYKETASSALN